MTGSVLHILKVFIYEIQIPFYSASAPESMLYKTPEGRRPKDGERKGKFGLRMWAMGGVGRKRIQL